MKALSKVLFCIVDMCIVAGVAGMAVIIGMAMGAA
jgi:hypothetical protein